MGLMTIASVYSGWCRKIITAGCLWIPNWSLHKKGSVPASGCLPLPKPPDILQHPQEVHESPLKDSECNSKILSNRISKEFSVKETTYHFQTNMQVLAWKSPQVRVCTRLSCQKPAASLSYLLFWVSMCHKLCSTQWFPDKSQDIRNCKPRPKKTRGNSLVVQWLELHFHCWCLRVNPWSGN